MYHCMWNLEAVSVPTFEGKLKIEAAMIAAHNYTYIIYCSCTQRHNTNRIKDINTMKDHAFYVESIFTLNECHSHSTTHKHGKLIETTPLQTNDKTTYTLDTQ